MKKLRLLIGLVFIFYSCEKNINNNKENTVELKGSNSEKTKLAGYDEWGFNWQAMRFDGYGINMILGDTYFEQVIPLPHFQIAVYNGEGEEFIEKLDVLLSNTWEDFFWEIFPKQLLDCHLTSNWNEGVVSKEGIYPDSRVDNDGWITFTWTYDKNGDKWKHFRKLVTIKSSWQLDEGYWYDKDGNEIGMESKYFPEYAVIMVENQGNVDTEVFYPEYRSPSGAGTGKYVKGK